MFFCFHFRLNLKRTYLPFVCCQCILFTFFDSIICLHSDYIFFIVITIFLYVTFLTDTNHKLTAFCFCNTYPILYDQKHYGINKQMIYASNNEKGKPNAFHYVCQIVIILSLN